jgi:hypothetical protein
VSQLAEQPPAQRMSRECQEARRGRDGRSHAAEDYIK